MLPVHEDKQKVGIFETANNLIFSIGGLYMPKCLVEAAAQQIKQLVVTRLDRVTSGLWAPRATSCARTDKFTTIKITFFFDIICDVADSEVRRSLAEYGHLYTMSMNVSEPKSVKIARDSSRTSGVKSTSEKPLGGWLRTRTWIADHTQWIAKNWNWSKLKPVIRCALVAWVAVVLFVIPRVEGFFGQVCGLSALLRYQTK